MPLQALCRLMLRATMIAIILLRCRLPLMPLRYYASWRDIRFSFMLSAIDAAADAAS